MSGTGPPRSVMRMSRQRMVAAGLLLTLTALGATGCRELTRASFSDSRTESVTINEIRIEGDSGSVTLDRSGSQVQIERTVFYRETKPSNRFDSVADGALVLNTSCGNNCEIQYKVHVPAAVKVTGHLDSGSIDVSDVTSATLNT